MADPAKIERMAKALGIPMPKKKKQPYTTLAGNPYARLFREGLIPESINKPISTVYRSVWGPTSRYPQETFPVVGARGEMKGLIEDAYKEYQSNLSQRKLDLAEQGGARLDAPWYSSVAEVLRNQYLPDLEPGGASELGIDFAAKLKEIQTGTTPSGYQRGPWRQAGFQMMSIPEIVAGEKGFKTLSSKAGRGWQAIKKADDEILKKGGERLIAARKARKQLQKEIGESPFNAEKIFDAGEQIAKNPIASAYAKARTDIQNLYFSLNPSQRTNWDLLGKIYRTYTAQQVEYQRLLVMHGAQLGRGASAKTQIGYMKEAVKRVGIDDDVVNMTKLYKSPIGADGFITKEAMVKMSSPKIFNSLERINPYKAIEKIRLEINQEMTKLISRLQTKGYDHPGIRKYLKELGIVPTFTNRKGQIVTYKPELKRRYPVSKLDELKDLVRSMSPQVRERSKTLKAINETSQRIEGKLQSVANYQATHNIAPNATAKQLIDALAFTPTDKVMPAFNKSLFPQLVKSGAKPIVLEDKSSWWLQPSGKLKRVKHKESYKLGSLDLIAGIDVGKGITREPLLKQFKRVSYGPKWFRNWVNSSDVKEQDLGSFRRTVKKYLGWVESKQIGPITSGGKATHTNIIEELADPRNTTESHREFQHLLTSLGVTNVNEEIIEPILWAIKRMKLDKDLQTLDIERMKKNIPQIVKAGLGEGTTFERRVAMGKAASGLLGEQMAPVKSIYEILATAPKRWGKIKGRNKPFSGKETAERIKEIMGAKGGVINQTVKSMDQVYNGLDQDIFIGFKGQYDNLNAGMAWNNLFSGGGGVAKESIEEGMKQTSIATIPSRYTIGLFQEIFGDDVALALLQKRTRSIKALFEKQGIKIPLGDAGSYTGEELFIDFISAPKSLLASFDVSAPMRQGWNVLFTEPRIWMKAWKPMIRSVLPGGEGFAEAMSREIIRNPNTAFFRQAGGEITGMGRLSEQMNREERFMSRLLTGIFPWVRPSERAFNVYINKTRIDLFSLHRRELEVQLGRRMSPKNPDDMKVAQIWAKSINNMTGRGPQPTYQAMQTIKPILTRIPIVKHAVKDLATEPNVFGHQAFGHQVGNAALTLTMFSPRMLTSRLALPIVGIKGDIEEMAPRRRMLQETYGKAAGAIPKSMGGNNTLSAMRSSMFRTSRGLVAFVGTGVTAVQFASMTPGDYIDGELDIKSPNFLKIKMGNTWYSPWAQYDTLARAIVQVITGKKRAITTDYEYDVNRGEVLLRFFRSKFSPTAGTIYNYLPGTTTFLGEEVNIWEDMKGTSQPWWDERGLIGQLAYPIFISTIIDAWDAYKKPVIPSDIAETMKVDESDEGAWDYIMNAIAAVGSVAAEATGIGTVTYITLDDITKELTGGEHQKFTELPPTGGKGVISQPTVRRIKDMREAQRGVVRQGPIAQNLEDLRLGEQREIDELPLMVVKYGNQSKPVSEWINQSKQKGTTIPIGIKRKITDEFFNIRLGYSRERRGLMRHEDAKFASPEATELKISQMDEKNQWLYKWYAIADQTTGIDEYSDAYDAFITNLRDLPNANELITWMRMNVYNIDIPPEILEILPRKTRIKYGVAEGLRQQEFGQEQFN